MKSMYFKTKTRAIIDVDPEFEKGIRRISRMNVPVAHRNSGIGTKLMREVCHDADKEGITLTLEPIPYDGPEKFDDLIRFYRRFSFELVEDVGCVRKPSIPQSSSPAS